MVNSYFLKINLDVFDYELYISYNQDADELCKYLTEWEVVSEEDIEDFKSHVIENYYDKIDTRGVFLYNGGLSMICLKERKDVYELLATLSHEITHFLFYFSDLKGIKMSEDSEEVFAYLSGYITRKFLKELQVFK